MTGEKQPPQRPSQACNACKRRKVRCNGQRRCQQCEHHGLRCGYPATPATSRGRSRIGTLGRGAVIAECRTGSVQPYSPNSTTPTSSAGPPTALPGTSLDRGFFYDLIPHFMAHVFPTSPVTTEAEMRCHIKQMQTSKDSAAFTYAVAAVTICLAGANMQLTLGSRQQVAELVTRSLEYRAPMGLNTKPTVLTILTNLFLAIAIFDMGKLDLWFFYLREAISLIHILRIGATDAEIALDLPERARRQRLYWECFIHERYLALTSFKPVCLDPLPSLPESDPTIPEAVEEGWNNLIQTFLLVDKDFVSFWTGDRSGVTAAWIQTKQQKLTEVWWHIKVETLPIVQQADLTITRQWLRTLIWQMAMRNVLLSSDAGSSDPLSLAMPLRLSSQLRQFLARVPHDAVTIHGIGMMVEKLFEITDTIADVVIHLPRSEDVHETRRRIHDVLFTKEFLLTLPRLKPVHKALLNVKFRVIRDLYPDIEAAVSAIGGRVDLPLLEIHESTPEQQRASMCSKIYDFPIVCQMVRDYCATPETSAPSERVFSIAGNLISKEDQDIQ
jgi:hypothetical protein